MNILIDAGESYAIRWKTALMECDPSIVVHLISDLFDPSSIDALLSWRPPAKLLPSLKNLKLLQCPGAGVDQILDHPELDLALPVARTVDPTQATDLAAYVLATTLCWYRRLDQYAALQKDRHWNRLFPHPCIADLKVGVLGAGAMGSAIARSFRGCGAEVTFWRRASEGLYLDEASAKKGLSDLASRCGVIVCALPLTQKTRGVLSKVLFDAMPHGGLVVNVGRGAHLVEGDLLNALASGQVSAAVLDVFEIEPLPTTSHLWDHPAIRVTPHIGAFATPERVAYQVVENLRRVTHGLQALNVIQRDIGY